MLKRTLITTAVALLVAGCSEEPAEKAPETTKTPVVEEVANKVEEVTEKVKKVTADVSKKVEEVTTEVSKQVEEVTKQVEAVEKKVEEVTKTVETAKETTLKAIDNPAAFITELMGTEKSAMGEKVKGYDVESLKNLATKVTEMITGKDAEVSKLAAKLKDLSFKDIASGAGNTLKDELSKLGLETTKLNEIYETLATQLKSLGVTIPVL